MSKTYKLLKKYPSLPYNWEVGMEVTIKPFEYNFTPVDSKYTNVEKGNSEIRNNPEYWEEVEEKTYEILEIRATDKADSNETLLIWTPHNSCYSLNQMLHEGRGCVDKGYYCIYSVKRLKDNQVFTIGDTVSCGNSTDIIKELKINNNTIYVSTVESTFGQNIENIEIYKEPIVYCITEDGVQIKNPIGVVYWVDKNFNICTKKASNCKSNVKYYSTRKAAENYIKCHKPVLSYQDVLSMFDEIASQDDWGVVGRNTLKPVLTKLVKSKLNMNE